MPRTKFGSLKVHPTAARFPMLNDEAMAALAADIEANGLIEPITISNDETILIDGRNRWLACQKVGIEPSYRSVPKSMSETAIVHFIRSKNLQRRHLDAGQRAALSVATSHDLEAQAQERKREHGKTAPGRKSSGMNSDQVSGRTRDQLADDAGVSPATVSQAMKVRNEAPALLDKVIDGTVTLNDAYKQVRDAQKPDDPKPKANAETMILKTHTGLDVSYPVPKAKSKFNRTNDQVSWSAWTWNPVTGCLHGCRYCYARELAMKASYRDIYPIGFEPLFHHERLDAPANSEIPPEAAQDPRLGRVFVCSMADLYGKWVPDEWIERVHASCIANPQWEYLMLTKFPRRYVGMALPATAWLGTSVDEQKRVRLAEEAFREIRNVRVKWLSLEPLLAPLQFSDLSMFDWIVIGSQTQTIQPDGIVPAVAPPFEWVSRIVAQAREVGCRVYLKPNLLGIPNDQSPGMILPQEEPALTTALEPAA